MEAVGVADRQHARPDGTSGTEGASVADGRIRRVLLHRADHRFQRHHRTQPQNMRLMSDAVHNNAGTEHIMGKLRIADRRAAVGTVADRETASAFLQTPDHRHEPLMLHLGIVSAFVRVLVGDGEVRKHALNLQAGQAEHP